MIEVIKITFMVTGGIIIIGVIIGACLYGLLWLIFKIFGIKSLAQ